MEKKTTGTKKLPIGHNEDVQYQAEMADEADLEAQKRARAADQRATSKQ